MQKTEKHIRQGVGYGLVQVAGVAVGAASTIWVYGHVLEVYGLVQFLLSTAGLLLPLTSLGVYALNYHFFPDFENKDNGHHGFLSLLLICSFVGTTLCLLTVWLLWPLIQSFAALQSAALMHHIWLLAPILLFTVLNFTLAHYAVNFGRMTVPALLNDLFLKLAVPALMLSFLAAWLDTVDVLYALTGYLGLITLTLLLYVRRFGPWRWLPDRQMMTAPKLIEMTRYAGYSTMTGLGATVLARLDLVMVGLLLLPESVGAYSIAITIASVIEIPFKTASTMSAPVISRQLHWYNYKKLEIYLNIYVGHLFFIALAIAGGIWLCSADLFALMPQKQLLDQSFAALMILALARLADAGMGLNGYVLMLSRYYRYHFGIVLIVLCVHVGLLYTLVPQYGIAGAALSTLIASLLFNSMTTLITYLKIGVHSFSGVMLTGFVIMITAGSTTIMLTNAFQATFFILLLKGAIYLILYFGLAFAFRLMPERMDLNLSGDKPFFKPD